MKQSRPLLLMAAGLLLLVSGFLYQVFLAGIPYQDPTPEMSAGYARHTAIGSLLCWLGLGMSVCGAVEGVLHLVTRRAKRGEGS